MSRSYWNTGEQYRQPDASQLRTNARQTIKKEKSKGKTLEPVIIRGRKIVNSWWGQAWCDNLEQYADYESRLERGKRYVRTGAVVDLKIQKGKVLARVQGRRKTPYKIEIRISPLSEERCQYAIEQCGSRIENLARLDENPLLFFELRGIDVDRFVDVTLANHVERMLANADAPSGRIIQDGQWEELFGVL